MEEQETFVFRSLPSASSMPAVWIYQLLAKLPFFQEAISETSSCVMWSGGLLLDFALKALGVWVVLSFETWLSCLPKSLEANEGFQIKTHFQY